MDYFSYFKKINYDGVVIPNIFKRAKIIENIKNNSTYFTFYMVQEGETPDSVAYNMYNDSNMYWLIMLTNNMFNPQFDWPLTSYELDSLIDKKYGTVNAFAVHHYETVAGDVLGSGVIVDSDYSGQKRAITNTEHETRLNEAKRGIRLIKPEYVNTVVDQFKEKIK